MKTGKQLILDNAQEKTHNHEALRAAYSLKQQLHAVLFLRWLVCGWKKKQKKYVKEGIVSCIYTLEIVRKGSIRTAYSLY